MGKAIRSSNPFLLGAEDNGQAPVKGKSTSQPQKQNDNPLVLGAEDTQYVKKKAGGDDSNIESSDTSHLTFPSVEQASSAFQNRSATGKDVDVLANTDQGQKMGLQSLSPDAKDIYVTAHNGRKKADLVNSVSKLIDDNYPPSQDTKQNQTRTQIKKSVLEGSQSAIQNLKKGLVEGLQQKINQRQKEIWRPVPYRPGVEKMEQDRMNNDPQIKDWKTQQDQIKKTIDEYGKMSLVNIKEMRAWLQLDADHPNIQTSVAAEKLGRMIEEKYGAERQTPNKEHDRMATGFQHIIESLRMDVNEALAYGIPTKNQELLKKAQDKLNTLNRYQDLYNKLDTEQFPDVGLDKTARFLGDIIADKHPNKLIRTKEDVMEAARIANEQNPGFMQKYGKFVDVAAQKQDEGTFIPRGGGIVNEFLGGLSTASAKEAANLLQWRARTFGYDKDKEEINARLKSPGMRGTTQSRTEATKVVYDKEGRAYRELPNENYGTLPWNNFFRFAGESAPGLAEFIASEGATKGIAQIATSKKASDFVGLIGATYINSYNTNREFADANIDEKTPHSEALKTVLANEITWMNALAFHALGASPSKLVESAISKNVMPEVINALEKNGWEKLSEKEAAGFIKEHILPRAKAVAQKFGENLGSGTRLGLASVVDQKVKDYFGSISNKEYKPSTVEDNARSLVSQALLMTVVGLPGVVKTGIMPHSSIDALHQAGLYAPQYIDMINERINDGDLDAKKGAGMISMVKTMGEEVSKALQETNDDGNPLTNRQVRDIAIANFRKRAAAAMEENNQSEPKGAESEADKQIKEIKKENAWQPIDETKTFKSIKPLEEDNGTKVRNAAPTEVNEKGGVGKGIKTMADIDPTKRYSWFEGENYKEGDGAELLHHLETGDIHDKEDINPADAGDKDSLDKTKKDATAEGKAEAAKTEEKTPVKYSEPVSEDGKAAIKEAEERRQEVENAGWDFSIEPRDETDNSKTPQVGGVRLDNEFRGKGIGTLGYILEGEALLKEGRNLISKPDNRNEEATGVWKKLVRLGLATVTKTGRYIYGGQREGGSNYEEPVRPSGPTYENGKAAIKEANERKEEIEATGFHLEEHEETPNPTDDTVLVGISGMKAAHHGKGLGTLGYILKGEEYLKEGKHMVSRPEYRSEEAAGVWEKLVKLGLAEETSPGYYRYEGERSTSSKEKDAVNEAVKVGDTFKIGGSDWRVVEDNGEKVRAVNQDSNLQTSFNKADVEKHINAPASEDETALQGSYDRLVANGSDPNDPEMKRLKERIENSSSNTTDNAQNVEKVEGAERAEGSERREDAGRSEEKSNEKEENVTPPGGSGPEGLEPAPASKTPIVGIRDSIMNADRIHRGLQPLFKEFVRSWGQNWNQLKRNIAKGFSPRKFIEETALNIAKNENARRPEKNRLTFSDYDFATLLYDRLDIQNNLLRAQDALAEVAGKEGEEAEGQRTAAQDLIWLHNQQLEQNEIVGRMMKSESGRALSAIQMMSKMNGELVRWSEDISREFNGHVPEKIKEFVDRIEKEYKEKNDQLQAHYEERLKKYAEEEFKKSQKETPKPAGNKKSITVKGKNLADKIRKLRPGTDTASANIFGLPIAVYDTAILTIANAVESGAKLIDAIDSALKDVKFGSDKDRKDFIEHLQNIEEPESPRAVQAGLVRDIKDIIRENSAPGMIPEIIPSLRKLMKSYVQNGDVKNLNELILKTGEELKNVLPGVDEKELRDAFSGYGMKPDTAGKLKTDLAKYKEQAKSVSEYQKALDRPSGETKAQEQKRLLKAAKLYEKVKEYMREAGIDEEPPSTTPEGRAALALEQAKSRATSIIEDLNRQISAGERKQRNEVKPDHELSILRAEQKRLSDQLKDLDRKDASPEEKIKQIEDTLNRQIANYERQIREGIDPLKPKEDRPSTEQIDELRKRKKELKAQLEKLRAESDPSADPKQKALAKYNESLGRQIVNVEEKISNKEYSEPEKPGSDFTRDNVSLALEARLKKLQSDFYATKRAAEAVNKPVVRKVMSLLSTTKRAFVLSRISTFGRLASAVAWNTIFEPAEAATGIVGAALSEIGFARKLNEQADRYGVPSLSSLGTHLQGEIAAFKALGNPQTWKDFVSEAKNGYSELSLLYGHANEGIPKEARDTWMNIEHGLEAFGRGHGAVKGVSKRMEFMRSYAIRKEAARRKGQDVDNPVIQQSIGAMAYQDAARSILMEDNIVSQKYQKLIHDLQNGGFGANVFALTLQEMMPIVKIPTNLVLNAGRATLGTPLAGGVIAVRGLIDLISGGSSQYGIGKLSAAESDALLRNLRKGNIGMALMLAGYFAPSMFGSSHFYQKGTDQPEGLEEGEVKFFGMTVPKWLADNPYLVTMKIGSSLRNSFNYYTDDQGIDVGHAAAKSFIQTASNTLKETPLVGTPSALITAAEGSGGNWFWYSQVKGTLEPGLLQEIAEDTDNRDGWYKVIGGDRIKRKPENIGEALKTGIPGLREEVGKK